MTYGEADRSNGVEADGIHMEIMLPDVVALAIPENKPGANTPVKLQIQITNNTPTPFRISGYGTLIPELVGVDGPPLPQQKPRGRRRQTREADFWVLKPGLSGSRSLTARLSWQNNKLLLEVPSETDYFNQLPAPIKPDNCWCFEGLSPGTYRLRLIYDDNKIKSQPDCDPRTRQVNISERVGEGRLATQFVNLRLIELVKSDSSAVEVDGIRFETVVPLRVLPIPRNGAKTRVQFGIRVTNSTSTPYRFIFFGLMPELLGSAGQLMTQHYSRNATKAPQESDFLLARPGESLTWLLDAEFSWSNYKLGLRGSDSSGGFWSFDSFAAGTYKVRWKYKNSSPLGKIAGGRRPWTFLEYLWTGMVYTPSVEFRLVHL